MQIFLGKRYHFVFSEIILQTNRQTNQTDQKDKQTYVCDKLDWVAAPEGEEGGLGGLVDVPPHVLHAVHRGVGLEEKRQNNGVGP